MKRNCTCFTGGLDVPIQRPYVQRDWRFGHYEMEGLQDSLSCLARAITSPLSFKKSKGNKPHQIEDEDVTVLQPLTL